jgi:peptidoglycan/LPS O-acetylase OafA/YrhL
MPGVEGLRAIAALTVLVYHVFIFSGRKEGPAIDLPGGGENAVLDLRFGLTLFFVLSGFLLYRPYVTALLRGAERPSTARYLRNRALRILPAYWLILLVTALVLGTAVVEARPIATDRLTDPGTLAADLLLVQMYSTATAFTGIGPAWSLAVEAVFYVVLPVLALAVFALARRGGIRPASAACAPVALLLVVGVATRVAVAAEAGDPVVREVLVRQSFLAQADLFALGMLVAVVVAVVEARGVAPPRGAPVAAAGAALLGVATVAAPHETTAAGGTMDLVAGCASACLVLACCLPRARRGWAVPALEWRPLVWIGLCSYSVYLWHTPVIFLVERHVLVADDAPSLALAGLLATAATLVLSAATYRWVERPALMRKRRDRPA